MKFNLVLIIIDLFLLVAFIHDWYSYYLKTGKNINYWYYIMMFNYFIPFLFMYPFINSDLNILSVGNKNISIIENKSNLAYTITLVGFSGVYFGKKLIDNKIRITIIEFFLTLISKTYRAYYVRVCMSAKSTLITSILFILIMILFTVFVFKAGLLGNPRSFFMANTQYRPIYNFITSVYSLIITILAVRIIQYNKVLDKILILSLIILGFFLGVRAPLFLQLILISVLFAVYKRNGYIPFTRIALFIGIFLVLIIGYALVRNQISTDSLTHQENSYLIFAYEIFYGNTFSDIRDFSWVLGYWNGNYYYGLTYLSALLSFVPSSLVEFRELYGIGKVTVNMLGFDPNIHPGVRPGMFGEVYLNFGIQGVIIFGIIWGYIQQKVSLLLDIYVTKKNIILGSSVVFYSTVIINFSITAGFFSLYCIFFILVLMNIFTQGKTKMQH